jgi:hypothetical protein
LGLIDKNTSDIENLAKAYCSQLEKIKHLSESNQEQFEERLKKEKENNIKATEIESKIASNKSLEEYIFQHEDSMQKSCDACIEENKVLKEKYERENKNLSELNELIKNLLIICKKIEKQVISIFKFR